MTDQAEADGQELLRVLREASAHIRERVFSSLDHTEANGYTEFLHLPAGEVALDLHEYDSDLEDADLVLLTFLVISWCRERERSS